MGNSLKRWLFLFTICAASGALAQNTVTVTDADISAGQTVNWTADNIYLLDGFVFVDSLATLNIAPGTVIKGMPGQGENASALIVARGGKIFATGTPTRPIIFTAEADDVTDPNDLPLDASGLWGGVIILGSAGLNSTPGETAIEGIPTTEPRGLYGGSNDEDDSGVFRYVSIRHGGTDIGAGNEINGLTMGGVGSKTTIEFVEIYGNQDDGFEWFGGTVNTRYLVSALNGDDAFDYDEGFRGKGQFWFAIQGAERGNRAGEHDGGTSPEDGMPFATPTISNVTYIGSGLASTNASNDLVFVFRDNAGGTYMNSIFTDFQGSGITIEDLASGEDSRARLDAGDLVISNNIWFRFGAGGSLADIAAQDFVQTHLTANGNQITDPMLSGISRTTDSGLDPRPAAGSPALSGASDFNDDFLRQTTYLGAFSGSDLWISGWTFLSEAGFVVPRPSNIIDVTDADIMSGQDIVWTADNTYILNGFVFVDDGATLTIEPGTVIKGKPGQGENASALIVARGGKIFANGTPTRPIIFTAEADDVNDLNDLPLDASGLWGGVIILGKAGLNSTPGESAIEGIPTTEARGLYGGSDDGDDSGVFRYVSIRYGGTDIGAGNEINGLTMGGVGSGTQIEFVEVYSNQDDGFEWFGGTVNTRNLVSAFNGDDAFDYDEGFRGHGQFWFAIQGADRGNRAGEHDGGTSPEDGMPFATPTIANATYIGSGANSTNADNDLVFVFRDNAGGTYMNSVFTDFQGNGVSIEDLASGEDSRARLDAGDLVLKNNAWFGFGAGNTLADIATQDIVQTHLGANNNLIVDPQLRGISRTNDGGLDPRPESGSPVLTGAAAVSGDFLVQTDYHGAFSNGELWVAGWAFISQAGFVSPRGSNSVTVTDADIAAGQTVNWTSDNAYILDGFVFVDNGATLTIEPGTVIKGRPGQGENASALIVARGGTIMANGTATQPIIFTAEADDVNDPDDLPLDASGLWGGVIILGNAGLNSTPGESAIEGIPTTEARGLYGGTDDNDNSGVFRYVSIRYGGTDIGAGNEINGLTMGGVGSGTTIEFIEVYGNQDDGFEWFGGTVNTRYLISAFNGDDAFDYDEGFRGEGQFWFAIQGADRGNRAGEHDGGTSPEDGMPFATPTIANATYIGSGANSTNADNDLVFVFRDNAGGTYMNSVFTDFQGNGVSIEDLASGEDSRARLDAGDLVLKNNAWFGFGAGNTLADIATQDFVQTHLGANNNLIVDPQLRGISRTNDGGLDPRPETGSPVLTGAAAVSGTFLAQTDYHGAFGETNWAADWSFIAAVNILSAAGGGTNNVTTGIEERFEPQGGPLTFGLEQNYPNPFNPTTNITFAIERDGQVRLTVYNQLGQQVATLVDGARPAGTYTLTWQAVDLSSGVYFYRLETAGRVQTKRMLLLK